jgi:hypothetical protein
MTLRVAGLVAAILAMRWITPPFVATCPFLLLSGLPCPLCGMTRALFLLTKAEWVEAVKLNAMSPLVGAAIVGLVLLGKARMQWVWGTLAAALGAYGVARIAVGALGA